MIVLARKKKYNILETNQNEFAQFDLLAMMGPDIESDSLLYDRLIAEAVPWFPTVLVHMVGLYARRLFSPEERVSNIRSKIFVDASSPGCRMFNQTMRSCGWNPRDVRIEAWSPDTTYNATAIDAGRLVHVQEGIAYAQAPGGISSPAGAGATARTLWAFNWTSLKSKSRRVLVDSKEAGHFECLDVASALAYAVSWDDRELLEFPWPANQPSRRWNWPGARRRPSSPEPVSGPSFAVDPVRSVGFAIDGVSTGFYVLDLSSDFPAGTRFVGARRHFTPCGVCVDGSGLVYLCDAGGGLQIYTREGIYQGGAAGAIETSNCVRIRAIREAIYLVDIANETHWTFH